MALEKRAWRCQKGHGAQEKGHGTTPCYFALDLTLFQVKHSIVRQKDMDFKNKPVHILEIAGPILPHHVQNLTALFHRTQDQDFSLTFNTHDPTVPFNFTLPTSANTGADRLKLDMTQSVHDPFFDLMEISDRLSCLKEVYCNKEGYSWIT